METILWNLFVFNRYAAYAAQPSQNYAQSAQVRFIIIRFFTWLMVELNLQHQL